MQQQHGVKPPHEEEKKKCEERKILIISSVGRAELGAGLARRGWP